MSLPRTRNEFKEYILRSLGKPVVKINVDDQQVEDRISEALQLYRDYHFDGTHRIFYKHVVTEEDRVNGYIDIPDYIQFVVDLFDIGMISTSSSNLFSLKYQFVHNELYSLLSTSMVPYYTAFTHIALIEQMLVGKQPIRHNRHINKCYIDMDWKTVPVGNYIILDCYAYTDPDEFPDVWSDQWLLRYAAALVKRQWGTNTNKYQNIVMAGGVTFNGGEIYNQADQEIKELREELDRNSPILMDFIG